MSARGWRYWLQDMLDCSLGEHGDYWRERADEAAQEAALGRTQGTWQEWRDIRQSDMTGEGVRA